MSTQFLNNVFTTGRSVVPLAKEAEQATQKAREEASETIKRMSEQARAYAENMRSTERSIKSAKSS